MSVFDATCAQLLHFEKNAYDGVLVAIAPHVPYSEADQLIKEIKDLFNRSSRLLFKATHQHASFGRVTIVVPQTWPKEYAESAYYGYHEAQVRIEKASPVHGDAPYTQQPGGCGQQGDFIHLTPDFLLNKEKSRLDYGPTDKVFVHEWAHFRYGVFDEYGYPGDPLYPQMYIKNVDTPSLTTCAYPELNVRFANCSIDQTTGIYNSSCKYQLDGPQIATSSLMGFHYLDNVNFFCESGKHNTEAPTKQNVLCDGRSTWDVIKSHEDFRNFKIPDGSKEPNDVSFNVVRAKKSPVFIVVDVSNYMRGSNNDTAFPLHQNRFNFVRKSLQILANILPEDTKLGLQEFDSTTSQTNLKELRLVSEVKKKNNFGKLLEPNNKAVTFKAMNDAITDAIQNLRKENGGILVLLTAGVEPPRNVNTTMNTLCERLKRDNVRVMSILYPPWESYKNPLQEHMTMLADRTNGRNFVIHEMTLGHNTKLNVLAQLTSAMLNIGQVVEPYTTDNFVIQSEGSFNGNPITGSVYIDKSVGKNARIMIMKSKIEDADFSHFILTSPSGRIVTPDETIIDLIGNDNSIMIHPLTEMGQWNYSIPTETSLQDQATLSIFTFSNPSSNEGTYIVRTWNNAKLGNLDPSSGNPLILYAEVKKGNDPVIGAKVIAKVQRPLNNDSKYTTIDVELLDNGNGAPDVTKNDGIYSRYFTDLNINGHFLVTVEVTDTPDSKVVKSTSAASSIHPMNPASSYCCGSIVPIKETTPTGEFKRVVNGGVFHVNEIPIEPITFPPSRITNLHIQEFKPQTGQVVLAWTAPGSEFDKGRASTYQVKYSNDRALLLDPYSFDHLEIVSNIPDPEIAGNKQEITITPLLDPAPKVVHYAVRAENNFKKSKISNVVTVRYPAKHLTTPTAGTSSTIPSSADTPADHEGGSLTQAHIKIIAGVLGIVFLLILIVLITLCIIKRRKKKSAPKAVMPLGSKKEGSFKNVSLDDSPSKQNGNGGVYTVNELMSSPQFMPASEVLAKHAQMKAAKERDYLDQDIKPSYAKDESQYSPTYDHINPIMVPNYGYVHENPPQDYYISRHDAGPTNNPFLVNYPPNYPFVRTSLSDKPSSSFTSLSTNEPKKDNGYFTSYEETSEDSNTIRPAGDMDNGLTSSKSSLARRIVAESQV